MAAFRKQTTLIAGLNVHTYTTPAAASSGKPVFGLFVLHGRMGSSEDVQNLVSALLTAAAKHSGDKDLMVVTFDHRNHGTRLESKVRNLDLKSNPNHVLDMYSIQTGTARDVSFVMDFLESYLFPLRIVSWGCCGISLGGHSTWIVGATDPRVQVVIPIIGCPDYLALMVPRAAAEGIAVGSPQFPDPLVRMIKETSLTSLPYTSKGEGNPFIGKKVLVLSGKSDLLVPWVASSAFVEGLEVGAGRKDVVVYEGVSHEVVEPMLVAVASFVLEEM